MQHTAVSNAPLPTLASRPIDISAICQQNPILCYLIIKDVFDKLITVTFEIAGSQLIQRSC